MSIEKSSDKEFQRDVARAWEEASAIPRDATWTVLKGGRSNAIWRVDHHNTGSLICKLYRRHTVTPVFKNDGRLEALALQHLAGSGLAPEYVDFRSLPQGDCLLYRHVDGGPWRGEIEGLAKTMAQLHDTPAPTGLPALDTLPSALRDQTRSLLATTGADLPDQKDPTHLPQTKSVLLHGDIVPGNVLVRDTGLCLIDWQSPAFGDPCHDIAIFLSPAMQVIYGHRPLTASEITTFLSAYETARGCGDVAARYRALAAHFHLRMAAYCMWKAAQGDVDYADAVQLELAMLDQC